MRSLSFSRKVRGHTVPRCFGKPFREVIAAESKLGQMWKDIGTSTYLRSWLTVRSGTCWSGISVETRALQRLFIMFYVTVISFCWTIPSLRSV